MQLDAVEQSDELREREGAITGGAGIDDRTPDVVLGEAEHEVCLRERLRLQRSCPVPTEIDAAPHPELDGLLERRGRSQVEDAE